MKNIKIYFKRNRFRIKIKIETTTDNSIYDTIFDLCSSAIACCSYDVLGPVPLYYWSWDAHRNGLWESNVGIRRNVRKCMRRTTLWRCVEPMVETDEIDLFARTCASCEGWGPATWQEYPSTIRQRRTQGE